MVSQFFYFSRVWSYRTTLICISALLFSCNIDILTAEQSFWKFFLLIFQVKFFSIQAWKWDSTNVLTTTILYVQFWLQALYHHIWYILLLIYILFQLCFVCMYHIFINHYNHYMFYWLKRHILTYIICFYYWQEISLKRVILFNCIYSVLNWSVLNTIHTIIIGALDILY